MLLFPNNSHPVQNITMPGVSDDEMAPASTGNKRKASQIETDEGTVNKDDDSSHVPGNTGKAKRPAVDHERTYKSDEHQELSVTFRIEQLEKQLGMYLVGTRPILPRLAALENEMIGSIVNGSLFDRLTKLEAQAVSSMRVIQVLEKKLGMLPGVEGGSTVLTRLSFLENSLIGSSTVESPVVYRIEIMNETVGEVA